MLKQKDNSMIVLQLRQQSSFLALLIMYKGSFHLQGWEVDEIAPPLSHRLQLQPLQQIITKAKDSTPKLTKTRLPTFSSTKLTSRETEPFHSTNVIRKKIKTQIEKKQLNILSQPIRAIKQDKRQEASSHQQYFKKTDANACFFKSIVTFIQKQPKSLKKSPRFVLQHQKQQEIIFPKNKRHSKSVNILPKKEPLKTKERFQTISKFKINFRNQDLNSKIIPVLKDSSLKKLKKFFLQTIQGIQSKSKQKMQKNHETKLKSMLQKSNRKKKQLEELFKSRLLVGTHLKQRKTKLTLQNLLIQPQQRANKISRHRMFSNNQFDDEGLFCPWSYKDQKIINCMKAKDHEL